MGWPGHILRLCIAAALIAFLAARPAFADDETAPVFAPACHAVSGLDRSAAAMIDRSAWTCTNQNWRSDYPVAWLRFDAASWQDEEAPHHFFSRTARFSTITFFAVDTNGTLLLLDGGLEDGRMVLRGQMPAPDGSGKVEHEISWRPMPDGRVVQQWRISQDGGENWRDIFVGIYTRKK